MNLIDIVVDWKEMRSRRKTMTMTMTTDISATCAFVNCVCQTTKQWNRNTNDVWRQYKLQKSHHITPYQMRKNEMKWILLFLLNDEHSQTMNLVSELNISNSDASGTHRQYEDVFNIEWEKKKMNEWRTRRNDAVTMTKASDCGHWIVSTVLPLIGVTHTCNRHIRTCRVCK